MSNYRKLVAGIVGVSLILLKHFTGIELPGLGDAVIEVAMAIGTWVSVWWFPNTPSSPQQGKTRPTSDVSDVGLFESGSREHPTSAGGLAGGAQDEEGE